MQTVRPHQPNQLRLAAMGTNEPDEIHRICDARAGLDIANPHGAIGGRHSLNRLKPLLKISRRAFERVAASWEPPNLVETELFQCGLRDVHVTRMRRIKTAAKYPYALPRTGWRQVGSSTNVRHL